MINYVPLNHAFIARKHLKSFVYTMDRVFVKPAKGLKVRKTQSEQFRHYKDEGEEVNKTKEVVKLLKYGDLVQFKQTRKKK